MTNPLRTGTAADLAPVYLLWGADTYSREQERRRLVARIVDPAWQALNLTVLPAETSVAEAAAAVQTPPFGSGGRVVVVTNSGLFSVRKGSDDDEEPMDKKTAADESDALLSLVNHNWVPGNCLIFTADAVDRRRRIYKAIETLGRVREFSAVKPWEAERILLPWLVAEATQAGVKITHDAAGRLLQAVGTDRQRLLAELHKVITFAGPVPAIQVSHVAQVVTGEEGDMFAWLELLARQQFDEALAQLQRLLLVEPVLKLVASLGTNLLRIYRMKLFYESGQAPASIAPVVASSPGLVGRTLKLWQDHSAVQIFRYLESLLAVEISLKSRGGTRPEQVGQLAVWVAGWKLAGKKRRTSL